MSLGELQHTRLTFHRRHFEQIPNELLTYLEDFLTERCRAAGTRFSWLDLPLTEERIAEGWMPPEVVDLLCAIRTGHTKAIETIMTKEYM